MWRWVMSRHSHLGTGDIPPIPILAYYLSQERRNRIKYLLVHLQWKSHRSDNLLWGKQR